MSKFLFSLFLLIAILSYLFFECVYNYDMLEAASLSASSELKATFEKLEIRGHRLSSIGFTLFLVPIFWAICKNIKFNFIILLALSAISYNAIFAGLTKLMDHIIAQNSDKRYEAYYINALKYGIIDGNFGFESYIDKSKSQSVEFKTLAANVFLLTFADKELSNRVKNASEKIAEEIYLNNAEVKQKGRISRQNFENSAEKIKQGFKDYNDGKKKINANFSELPNQNADGEYEKFSQNLNKKYNEYLKNSKIYESEKRKHFAKIDEYEKDLQKYFKYPKFGERKYRENMQKNFGHYINPNQWCYKGVCPHKEAIARTIDKESKKSWNARSGGVEPNLSPSEFFNHAKIKSQIIAELRKNGLNVTNNFNYSKSQFVSAYNASFSSAVDTKFQNALSEFRKKFQAQTGIKNVDLNLDWAGFVRLFEPEILENFKDSKRPKFYANEAINLITTGKLGEFFEKIYKPLALENFDKKAFLYTQKDFSQNETAILRGDNALKALYIPPFAIFMSLLSIILNVINLISLVLKFNFAVKGVCMVAVFGSIWLFSPKFMEQNALISQLLKSENQMLTKYLKTLDSIIWLENFNEKLNKKFREI